MIEYKAKEKGIKVADISEKNTSKTCNRCGTKNTTRKGQELFRCKDFGLEDNTDKNSVKCWKKSFW